MRLLAFLLATALYLTSGSGGFAQVLPLHTGLASDSLRLPLPAVHAAVLPPHATATSSGVAASLRLDPAAAGLLGGVVGAAVGFGLMRFSCKDRFCEMGDLVGILAGALIGSTLGRALAGDFVAAPPRVGALTRVATLEAVTADAGRHLPYIDRPQDCSSGEPLNDNHEPNPRRHRCASR